MKKTTLRALLFLLILTLLLPCTALADTGPKPSMSFTLRGMPQEEYYVTILSQVESTGPHSAYDTNGNDAPPQWALSGSRSELDYSVWQKFVDYQDADGFYFLTDLLEKCSGDTSILWGYYPPETVKLLLYFPGSDTFLESGIYERYAFHSSFTLDLGGVSPTEAAQPLALQKSAGVTSQLLPFLARLALTLVVELGLALLFGYRSRRQILHIIAVNAATQVLLNIGLFLAGSQMGYFSLCLLYLLLELLIFVAEALLYRRLLLTADERGDSKVRRRVVLYALAANAASFGAGLLLSRFVPFLF